MLKLSRLSCVCLLALSGCGLTGVQHDATSRFAKASSHLGSFSAQEFTRMRQAVIAMNTQDMILTGKVVDDLDGKLDATAIADRVAAANALAEYGSLLMALLNDTQEEALHAASAEFVTSSKRVAGKKLSDQQLDALGNLVQNIGGLWVEYKKANALKRIVKTYRKDVETICELLNEDFKDSTLRVGQNVDLTIKRLKMDADIVLAEAQDKTLAERKIATAAFRLADDEAQRLKQIDQQMSKTIMALKAANAELADVLSNDSTSAADIKTLSAEIQKLAVTTKALVGK